MLPQKTFLGYYNSCMYKWKLLLDFCTNTFFRSADFYARLVHGLFEFLRIFKISCAITTHKNTKNNN